MSLLLFCGGLLLLLAGAELLVRGASRTAAAAGISPLVVGLTVVAFGTSAPELAVSVAASLRGDGDIAVGNVVGSNVFNVLCILGTSALAAPLLVSRQLIREQVPLMIGASGLLWLLVLDGNVSRAEGTLLVVGIVGYTGTLIVRSRREEARSREAPAGSEGGTEAEASGRPLGVPMAIVCIVAGLGLLVLGSRWLVDSARDMAAALGVSDLVVGLTVVAAGTSLPELATSVVASFRGERDIAVGNIVGSNLFNILAILGTAAAIVPGGVEVAPAARSFDVPVMAAVALACLPVFLGGWIHRWEGALFLGYYVAYVVYLVLDTSGHHALPEFRAAMTWFVLPLTAVTLVVVAWRATRGRSTANP